MSWYRHETEHCHVDFIAMLLAVCNSRAMAGCVVRDMVLPEHCRGNPKEIYTNVHRCWFFWPSHLKTNRSFLRIYGNHAKQLEAIAK